MKHRAKYATLCLDSCNGDLDRKYFWVWENSIETNDPTSCACMCPGIPFITGQNILGCFELFVVPPNVCCPGADNINKTYFDRGVFDTQSCCYKCGFFSGGHKFHANEIKHVCCCMECPDAYDQCLSCYWPELCGERVRYVPSTTCCWCWSTEASNCSNCCWLYGVKTGEPDECCLRPITTHLEKGEAERLAASFNASMEEWRAYTGAA